jgi:hypothetical protein
MHGMFASSEGSSWTDEIIEEHRKEREREERLGGG